MKKAPTVKKTAGAFYKNYETGTGVGSPDTKVLSIIAAIHKARSRSHSCIISRLKAGSAAFQQLLCRMTKAPLF